MYPELDLTYLLTRKEMDNEKKEQQDLLEKRSQQLRLDSDDPSGSPLPDTPAIQPSASQTPNFMGIQMCAGDTGKDVGAEENVRTGALQFAKLIKGPCDRIEARAVRGFELIAPRNVKMLFELEVDEPDGRKIKQVYGLKSCFLLRVPQVLYDRPVYQSEDLKHFLYWMRESGNMQQGLRSQPAQSAMQDGGWCLSCELGVNPSDNRCLAFAKSRTDSPDLMDIGDWCVRDRPNTKVKVPPRAPCAKMAVVVKLSKPPREKGSPDDASQTASIAGSVASTPARAEKQALLDR